MIKEIPQDWGNRIFESTDKILCAQGPRGNSRDPSKDRARLSSVQFSSVQSLSHVQLFVTPWTVACQASLSIINSQSPPKPMSILSVMPSNHFILCFPLLLPCSNSPSIRVFSNESVLHVRWPSIGVSASASVLPMNIHD